MNSMANSLLSMTWKTSSRRSKERANLVDDTEFDGEQEEYNGEDDDYHFGEFDPRQVEEALNGN